MTVPSVVLGVILEKISFSSKMSLSKQKKLYYQLVNKGRNRERKEDWRGAVAYVARKWMVCNFLMKLPDNFYSSVGGNFELWVLLGSLRVMFEILVLILSQKILIVYAESK